MTRERPGYKRGGRYSGAAITNTTYHVWAVAQALGANPDIYFDPSAVPATVLGHLQAETGGSAYLYVRRIGSIVRASAAIKAFKQYGDYFQWADSALDVDVTTVSTTAANITLTLPVGIQILAQIHAAVNSGAAGDYILISSLDVTNETVSNKNASLLPFGASQGEANFLSLMTNTSAQLRIRSGAGAAGLAITIRTRGWIDSRGRQF